LGIDLKDNHLELWPTEEDQRYIDSFLNAAWLSENQKIVGINISASPRWASKSWPQEYILKLCEELGLLDIRVVFTGTGQDALYANMLANTVSSSKIINLCGKTTINQLAALIKKCAVYLSADSAPLHIASAMKTPFIGLFGPTDPERHIPPGEDCIVIKKDLKCSPCYRPKCSRKKCMYGITPQEVLEAIKKLIK
jgi:heptosyltransferase-2